MAGTTAQRYYREQFFVTPENRLIPILASWRQWPLELTKAPEVVAQLSAGRTNHNLVLQAGSQRLRLRLNAPHARQLGIIRQHELAIIQALQPLGCTPAVLYHDSVLDFTVFPFIEGEVWQDPANENRQELLTLLTEIRTVKPAIPPRNYGQYIDHYLDVLEQHGVALPSQQQQSLNKFREQLPLLTQSYTPQLVHHDLIPENILQTDNGVIILDWEYAALGHPTIDDLALHALFEEGSGNSQGFSQNSSVAQLVYWMSALWEMIDSAYSPSEPL